MKTLLRVGCLPVVLSALLVGCGNDKATKSSSTTVVNTSPTTAQPAAGATSTSLAVGGVVQNVTDGTACSPQGARGATKQGVAELCTLVGGDTRWRPA